MTKFQNTSLFLLRIAMGWLFLYAGITKILNPSWTAAGYLGGAKTFTGFYHWLASPGMLPFTNFVNEWGLTLLGLSLIFGIGVRISSVLGALLMLLYYFPILTFPYTKPNAYLVDDHIIFALLLVFFSATRAGRTYGFDAVCKNWPICGRFPKLHDLLS